MCDESDESCMMSNCDNCESNFSKHISEKIADRNKMIEWSQWMNINGRAVKKQVSGRCSISWICRISTDSFLDWHSVWKGSIGDCVKLLEQKTPQYLWHVYVKRKQSEFFEQIKNDADGSTVVCQVDYAENFGMEYQDQIQSAHWAKKYVSIFTAYAWWGGSGGEGQSFGLVSNSIKHTRLNVFRAEIFERNREKKWFRHAWTSRAPFSLLIGLYHQSNENLSCAPSQ